MAFGGSVRLQCNSCGATYPDTRKAGSISYFHACPTEVVDTYAVCDTNGNTVKAATFKPLANPRNENLKPHPDKPGEYVMISEGSGITEVE